MDKKIKIILLLGIIGVAFCGIIVYDSIVTSIQTVSSTLFAMDTFITQKWVGKNAPEALREIEKEIFVIESQLSMYAENSDIYNINANAGNNYVRVSERTFNLIKTAKEYSEYSDGLFDVTIAPLTKEWGITSTEPQVPSREKIDSAMKLIDYNDILLDNENMSVKLAREGQAIDLGGIAKGAACVYVREIANKYVVTGYISVGGNIMITGNGKKADEYVFGIRNPKGESNEVIGTIKIGKQVMATTGGYERYFQENGEIYHHILNPKTGYPAESDFLSITVVSEDGTMADFLSTSFFMLEKEEVMAKMNDENVGIIAVDKEENVYVSDVLKEQFEPSFETGYSFIGYEKVLS